VQTQKSDQNHFAHKFLSYDTYFNIAERNLLYL